MVRVKDLLEEYIELHTSLIKYSHGVESTYLHNGKMTPHYKLGLYEANLEYILLNNDEERERFKDIIEYLRSNKKHREKESNG